MTDKDNELLNIFWEEVGEYLSSLNEALLQIEMASGDEQMAMLREMNRVAHSMKGAARAVGFGLIETIAHYMEEVFQAALNNHLEISPDMADTLYDGLDLIQNTMAGEANDESVTRDVLRNLENMVAFPQSNGKVPHSRQPVEHPAIVNQEDDEEEDYDEDEVTVSAIPPQPVQLPTIEGGSTTQTMLLRTIEETIRVPVGKLDRLMAEASELIVARMQGELRSQRLSAAIQRISRWQREWRTVRASYIRLARRIGEQDEETADEMAAIFRFLESNQRNLMETYRELSHLTQLMVQDNMQLNTLSDTLQGDIASLRMMPFESISAALQRMVRDLARDTHKNVHLEIKGVHVEIDRTVLDALKEPLMHLLRNAVDHGLETPEEREVTGKSTEGTIQITVEQRGSEIVIDVSDDGRGIDLDRIRQKAVERGLLSDNDASSMADEEARQLIFRSGFSTSDRVTAISGRGLGMDIVRERIEGLRGRISVSSREGEGSTVMIAVPVSLTRIRAVLLRLGDEEYAVPAAMVQRMVTVPRDMIYTAEGRNLINLLDHPTPVVSLAELLDAPVNPLTDSMNVIVLRTTDRSVAFEVDYLYSEMELVLKPLGPELASTPFVAGAALLGSGEIVVVLDAAGLIRKAAGAPALRRSQTALTTTKTRAERRLHVLVVDDSITTRTLEKNILEAVGFRVTVAVDGAEGWARLAENEIDVIISDVEMPNVNGLEFTRQVKGHPATRDIPLILLTSLAKPEQREAGLQAGADAYLVKSQFDQQDLLNVIHSVI